VSDFVLGLLVGAVVGAAAGVAVLLGLRRRPAADGGALPDLPQQRAERPPPREAASASVDLLDEVMTESRIASKDAEARRLRQDLRARMLHDEEKVERALAAERERAPQASEIELLRAALYRWERDNR
jgi:hypothetical protein